MEKHEIWKHIDHTLLRAAAAWDEVRRLCAEALEYGAASVCVAPSFVAPVRAAFGGLRICTVAGFPLGYATRRCKVEEAREAASLGADEIDMVINLGDVKSGKLDAVREEIAALREALPGRILKVIVETCYLEEAEKIALCGVVTEAGADYIKTSTGFGPAGATLEDVALFKRHLGPSVKIKAAGGISTLEEITAFIEAGCARIGTSRAGKLLV
ncbi:MAG: deoxyribose-phosphate aldolase [Spirochaetaceae bacterium]|jgi:deoxyribose-phosphate aldolase|nr:deoxyribose-phosphate aldolase [Spirochaetaceae bacterium]